MVEKVLGRSGEYIDENGHTEYWWGGINYGCIIPEELIDAVLSALESIIIIDNKKESKAMEVKIYEREVKKLDKGVATSIICDSRLMDANERLTLVADNRDNRYYLVDNTNSVIMHVEEEFCILVDYLTHIYNEIGKVSLPVLLSAAHYGVYQTGGPSKYGSRDWVKNTSTGDLIGYNIKETIHGVGCRIAGTTLDHEDATFDEREKVKNFSSNNINNGSHRVKVSVNSQEDLNELIDKIVKNEGQPGGLFF